MSENLIYDILLKAIKKVELSNTEVLCHYPLKRLIADWSILDEKEIAFAANPLSHVDFLIYNSLTKQPLKTIEVDGWHFHKNKDTQQSRDILKDNILSKFGLTPNRLSTTSVVNVDTMAQILASIK